MDFTHKNALLLMEAAGIEPASENVQQESLHTYQVPIYLTSDAREPATSPERQPVKFTPVGRASQSGLSCMKSSL